MIVPRSSRLRVGECLVDAGRRIVVQRDGGREARLTVKALQVLLALVEQAGQVVSREVLFERVWPDTMPTDDVLTQAVTQLRKAFGDDRDAPRYVETIAKGGYRLVADVEWLHEEPVVAVPDAAAEDVPATAAAAPEAASGERGWRSMPVVLVFAWIAVVAVVVGAWQWRKPAAPTTDAGADTASEVPMRYRAITSAPGQERLPSLSPDGAMVAYSQTSPEDGRQRLMLQGTSQVPARALTSPPEGGADRIPVWSRNGTRIAFVRTVGDDCMLMVISTSGGDEQEVGDCLLGAYSTFDWTPDGRGLVMGGLRDPDGSSAPLRVLDLSSGHWRVLDYAIADHDVDLQPRYSPDGRWLAFRRNTSLADLWLMPAGGGKPRRLTELKGDIRGWDWLPDGSGLVLSLIRSGASLFVYSLRDGRLRPLQALNTGNAVFPDIAADDWSMVFEIDQMRSGIFRFPLGGEALASSGKREPLFPSTGVDLLPGVSPDGATVAFISDRAMSVQLWIGDPAQPGTLRAIEGVQPVPRHPPVWSADGSKLLVVGRVEGGDRLFEVDAVSDEARVLPVPDAIPAYAAYTDDPARLLVGVDGGQGRLRLMLYALPSWEALASIDDVAVARYAASDGNVYFTRPSLPGLWQADAELRGSVRIDDSFPPIGYYRQWGVVAGRPFYNGPYANCQTTWMPIPRDEAQRTTCLVRDSAAIAGSPSADRAGQWLYVGLPLNENIDAGWASLDALRGVEADVTPAIGHDNRE